MQRTLIFLPEDALLVRAYMRREGAKQFQNRLVGDAVSGASGADKAVIALLWLAGSVDGKPNVSKAEEWAFPAAKSGHPYAEWVMAFVELERGNVSEMIVWLEKSAAQDFAPAAYELGRIHASGIGYPQDLEQAIAHLKHARMLGSVLATPLLGKLLSEHGDGLIDRVCGFALQAFGTIRVLWYSQFRPGSIRCLAYAPLMTNIREMSA